MQRSNVYHMLEHDRVPVLLRGSHLTDADEVTALTLGYGIVGTRVGALVQPRPEGYTMMHGAGEQRPHCTW